MTTKLNVIVTMGVQRLFYRGGQNFPKVDPGGGKNILFALKHHILFCPAKGGVAIAPSCPPLQTPMNINVQSKKSMKGQIIVEPIVSYLHPEVQQGIPHLN